MPMELTVPTLLMRVMLIDQGIKMMMFQVVILMLVMVVLGQPEMGLDEALERLDDTHVVVFVPCNAHKERPVLTPQHELDLVFPRNDLESVHVDPSKIRRHLFFVT